MNLFDDFQRFNCVLMKYGFRAHRIDQMHLDEGATINARGKRKNRARKTLETTCCSAHSFFLLATQMVRRHSNQLITCGVDRVSGSRSKCSSLKKLNTALKRYDLERFRRSMLRRVEIRCKKKYCSQVLSTCRLVHVPHTETCKPCFTKKRYGYQDTVT